MMPAGCRFTSKGRKPSGGDGGASVGLETFGHMYHCRFLKLSSRTKLAANEVEPDSTWALCYRQARRRRTSSDTPTSPTSDIAQVPGSGTASRCAVIKPASSIKVFLGSGRTPSRL